MTAPAIKLVCAAERDAKWAREKLRELLDDPSVDFSGMVMYLPARKLLLRAEMDNLRAIGSLDHAKWLLCREEDGGG